MVSWRSERKIKFSFAVKMSNDWLKPRRQPIASSNLWPSRTQAVNTKGISKSSYPSIEPTACNQWEISLIYPYFVF